MMNLNFELALSNQGYQPVFTIFLNSFFASSLSNCTFRQSFDLVRKQKKNAKATVPTGSTAQSARPKPFHFHEAHFRLEQ